MSGLDNLVHSLASVIVRYHDAYLMNNHELKEPSKKDGIDLLNSTDELRRLIQERFDESCPDNQLLYFLLNEIKFLKSIIPHQCSSSPYLIEQHVIDITKMLINFKYLLLTPDTQLCFVTYSTIKRLEQTNLSDIDEPIRMISEHPFSEHGDDDTGDLLTTKSMSSLSESISKQSDIESEEICFPLNGLEYSKNEWTLLGTLFLDVIFRPLNIKLQTTDEEIYLIVSSMCSEHYKPAEELKEADTVPEPKIMVQGIKSYRSIGWGYSLFAQLGIKTFFPSLPMDLDFPSNLFDEENQNRDSCELDSLS